MSDQIVCYENATILPWRRENVERFGCAYDSHGRRIDASVRLTTQNKFQPVEPETIPPMAGDIYYSDEKIVLLGHYLPHYGHFLFETLSQMWCLDHVDLDEYRPVFLALGNLRLSAPERHAHFATVCLTASGIDVSRVDFIKRATRYREVLIPERRFKLRQRADPSLLRTCRRIVEYCRNNGGKSAAQSKRLFLTRRYLTKGQGSMIDRFDVLEQLFERAGFQVIAPERIPFMDQVATYASVDVIAGIDGSALHNVLFMPAGSQVITVKVRPNPNVAICNELAGATAYYIPVLDRYAASFPQIEAFLHQHYG